MQSAERNAFFKINKNLILIIGILLLGTALRLYNIGEESLWQDEAYSIMWSKLGVIDIIKTVADDFSPPIYYILLHFWMKFFGSTEIAIRLLSVVFDLFAILMIYRVGSLIFNENVGLLSAFLLGLSTFHIHYSHDARFYTLLSVLTLISYNYLVLMLKDFKTSSSCGYIVFTVLLIYTHVYGLFIVIAQNLFYLTNCIFSKSKTKLSFKWWSFTQLIIIIFFLPWLKVFANQVIRARTNPSFQNIPPDIISLFGTIWKYSGSHILLLFFLCLFLLSVVKIHKSGGNLDLRDIFGSIERHTWKATIPSAKENYLLIIWFIIPILLPFIISHMFTDIYFIRCTISSSLAFYILVAKGINNFNSQTIRNTVLILISLFALFNFFEFYQTTRNEQWREVAKYIDKNANSKDLLIVDHPVHSVLVFCFNYYSNRPDLKKMTLPESSMPYDQIENFSRLIENKNRIWIILCQSSNKDWIQKSLKTSYNMTVIKKFVGIQVYLYEKEKSK